MLENPVAITEEEWAFTDSNLKEQTSKVCNPHLFLWHTTRRQSSKGKPPHSCSISPFKIALLFLKLIFTCWEIVQPSFKDTVSWCPRLRRLFDILSAMVNPSSAPQPMENKDKDSPLLPRFNFVEANRITDLERK